MAHAPSSGVIRDPLTGEPVAATIRHTPEDLERAVRLARAAQPRWHQAGLAARARIVHAVGTLIAEEAGELAATVAACTGKPRVDALGTEIVTAALLCRYYPRLARRALGPRRLRRSSVLFFNKRSVELREPYGVIGVISPWNYPFGIPMHEVVQALLAGNAVVLKVATQAQPVGEAIAELFRRAELPEGLLALIHMPGDAAGPLFVSSGIDKLLFTGSTETGLELAALAARRLLPVSLELGGNDAMIVLDDADLSRAVDGAIWAGLSNSGQSCAAPQRIYVEQSVHRQFVELARLRISRLRRGVELGALTTAEQLRTVVEHVADARRRGAEVWMPDWPLTPVGQGPPYLHPPVLVDHADGGMLVCRRETFGPVLAVQGVTSQEQAIGCANDSDLGLSASIWSRNAGRARRIAARLEVGVVTINDHLMSHGMPETAWGGYKRSSVGRCHGEAGFREVTRGKTVVTDLLHRLPRNFWWLPYAEGLEAGLRGAVDLLCARGLIRRARGAARLLRTYARGLRRPDVGHHSS